VLRACHLFLVALFLAPLLGACGAAGPTAGDLEAPRAPQVDAETRSIEELLVDVPVTKVLPCLPDLDREDRTMLLLRAKEANPKERIRSVLLLEAEGFGEMEARVVYAPHEVKERTLRYHSAFFVRVRQGEEGVPTTEGTTRWVPSEEALSLEQNLEVCPPWRSYESGAPPLEAERVHFWSVQDLQEDVLIAIADALRSQIPAGEHVAWIDDAEKSPFPGPEGDGGRPKTPGAVRYDVLMDQGLGAGGSVFTVENRDEYWTNEFTGEWIE